MENNTLLCKMKFLCDKKWDDLRATQEGRQVRYCGDCDKHVHWCADNHELAVHAGNGHCVAFMVEKVGSPASEHSWSIGEVEGPPYEIIKA